jgi:hypothetical protein
MLIKDTFAKPIDRRIDGVIKADQLDQESLWLELDEFVITAEVRKHMSAFFSAAKDSVDSPKDPAIAGRNGVWISGFFGSGKSMLLKILSLLSENQPVTAFGQTKAPLDFVLPKIGDALTEASIRQCCGPQVQSILFNVDSKGDAAKGDAAILDIFYRVFNEHRGRCAVNPDVAEFEDVLEARGWLEPFIQEFEHRSGKKWGDCAGKYLFFSKEIRGALQAAGNLSEGEAEKQFASIKGMASLSPENFAEHVAKYLGTQGDKARITFWADEVGQFVGKNTRLMLSLQTITEELGVKTRGRAWVVVTAQEDLEAIIGDLPEKRANDFSKIQGRFYTKLKLSSSNADEVIQRRLLEKTSEGIASIKARFGPVENILQNAVSFKGAGMSFRKIGSADNFAAEYPFLPYQFQLVPKILSAIRKRGVTGQHLAEGERSMLDSFQLSARSIAHREVSALVPLSGFYSPIENYLEGVVKRTIDQAPTRGLSSFDVELLKTLFLIRWVEEVKGNVDTLVTLLISDIDQNLAKLKTDIEASLQKLESETLVSRAGENYYFLTDEEQAVDREIRQVTLQLSEDSREVGRLVFTESLKDKAKFRYKNGKDFTINRMCDGRPVSSVSNPEIEVRLITPFDGEYSLYSGESKGIMSSAAERCLVIVLTDDKQLTEEITKHLQINAYLRARKTADVPKETKRIQEDRGNENEERRARILSSLKGLFAGSRFYVAGNSFSPKSSEPTVIFDEAIEKLIDDTFDHLRLLKKLSDKPQADLQLALKANDVQKQLLEVQESENREAIAAVNQRIDVLASQETKMVVSELVTAFSIRPYGWPDFETVLILGRLLVAGRITLQVDGQVIKIEDAFEPLSKPGRWKQIRVIRKQELDAEQLAAARSVANKLFHSAIPSAAEQAVRHIQQELETWRNKLAEARPYANQTNRYPGKAVVDAILTEVETLLEDRESTRFIKAFLTRAPRLEELQPKYTQVIGFYGSQRPAWDRLLDAYERCRVYEAEIRERDMQAGLAISTLREILTSPEPYARIAEANKLLATIDDANQRVIAEAKSKAKHAIEEVQQTLDEAIKDLSDADATEIQRPLRELRESIEKDSQSGNLRYVRERVTGIYNAIADQLKKKSEEKGIAPTVHIKPIKTVRPAAKTLETTAEVDAYLGDLRTEILLAIESGQKVQVQ